GSRGARRARAVGSGWWRSRLARRRGAGLRSATGWPSTRRLRQQPLRPDLTRPRLEVALQLADLVELGAELLDPAKLRGDLRERARRILLQPFDAPFARLELSADGARPCVGLLAARAELRLRRRPVVEHLAESLDQGEIERLLHLGQRRRSYGV